MRISRKGVREVGSSGTMSPSSVQPRSLEALLMPDPSASVCDNHGDLFFGTAEDGRMEEGRVEREQLAAAVCFSCPVRLRCLERALVLAEPYGVWGGMSEGERRRFARHTRQEGYRSEVPTGDEMAASLRAFYKKEQSAA